MTVRMTRSQQKAASKQINAIVNKQGESDADQVFHKTESRVEDGITFVDVYCRIENPVDGYECDWYWADEFGVTKRGRII